MKLFQVPHTHIDKAWRDGASNLERACERGDEVTPSQLKLMLSRNERQLLGVEQFGEPRGWAVVGIEALPNYRALAVYAAFAPGCVVLDQLKEYARANGCVAIRIACDDAGARLWSSRGAKKKYQVMEWEV